MHVTLNSDRTQVFNVRCIFSFLFLLLCCLLKSEGLLNLHHFSKFGDVPLIFGGCDELGQMLSVEV